MTRPTLREVWLPILLVAVLAVAPAFSVYAAGWSERLEPVPFLALAGVVVGLVLGRSQLRFLAGHGIGLGGGLALVTFLYAWVLPQESVPDRVRVFVARVSDWLAAAFSGAASTDNLLFAYSMGLLAWLLGYLGAWFVVRRGNPWWAIVPTGSALLLNLSYSPPDLLPLVFVQIAASFVLLVSVNSMRRVARWRSLGVEQGLHWGFGFAVTAAAVTAAIVLVAWTMPVGQVSRGVASAWENFAGPWQSVQSNFDRLFASLNPSPLSGRGLTASGTMAPRGSFELGDDPVLRVAGREPAYWRAVTYDRYSGQVMAASQATSQRRDRRQPLEGAMETDEGRKFVEYTVTMLAPSSSIVYAPDTPLTVSIPTVYDYRSDQRDFGALRPATVIREQQRYNVLTSVSTASASELRQAGTIYPAWTRSYLQLPPGMDTVRNEAWRVIGDATNVYEAASRVEQYLRGFKYSTRVRVPPPDKDWVAFLLFESKEGYCDYYAAAMTVMLRSIGIPARVASGYVTGDYDPATQTYLVTERHAHTWTEVYFPKYGWITFEPSAIRPGLMRLENPLVALTEEELARLLESEMGLEDFLDDEELFDSGTFVPLPGPQTGPAYPPALVALFGLVGAALAGSVVLAVLWFRGMAGLPTFARAYAQVARLATWCGVGPRRSQTPYEYTRELAAVVPAAAQPLQTIADAYVAGTYGAKRLDLGGLARVRAAAAEARATIFRSLAVRRWQRWVALRLTQLAGAERAR